MFCAKVKEFLSQNKIEYTSRNIAADESALAELEKLGYMATPVTVVDGEVVSYEYMLGSQVEYVSLEAMLRTIATAYQAGVIFMGEDNDIDYEEKAYARIARRFNPGIKAWAAKKKRGR